jgi:hypothetical protein
MDLVSLGQFIEKQGVSVAVLAFLCFALWRCGVWLAIEIIKPVTTKHIGFVDRVENVVTEMKDVLVSGHKQTSDKIDQLHAAVKESTASIKGLPGGH